MSPLLSFNGVRALLKLLRAMSREGNAGIVLLYHRISSAAGDPNGELVPAVSVATLTRQMRWLRLFFRLVPAASLPQAVEERRRWRRFPVAVTFDDDNPEHVDWVLPTLRERGVKATFFLTGLCLDGRHATWWELLQGAADEGLPTEALLGGGDVHVQAERVKEMQPEERDRLVEQLVGMGARAQKRPVTPDDLVAISREHDVGFHTRRHDYLPVLSDEDLERSLRDGREELERLVGRSLDLFAYPHGGGRRREAAAARRAGYRLGFTTAEERWETSRDPLRIGRVEVREEPIGSVVGRLVAALTR